MRQSFVFAAFVFCLAADAQGAYGFLKNSPVASFKSEDLKLMRAAAEEVLTSAKIGTARTWENIAAGNSGTITLLASFTSTLNRDCRKLQIDNVAKGISGSSTQVVCRASDGRWLFDTGAKPRQP